MHRRTPPAPRANRVTRLAPALLALLPLGGTAAQAQPIKVAIIGAEATANSSWVTDVQNKLISTGFFSSVDVFNGNTTTPTLAQLQTYRSVLVWSDSGFADATALGNNLFSYVNGGGGVVQAVFADAGITPLGGQ